MRLRGLMLSIAIAVLAAPQTARAQDEPDDKVEESELESLTPEAKLEAQQMGRALKEFQAGRIKQALILSQECLQKNPRCSSAARLVALCYVSIKDNERAAAALLHALNLNPSDDELSWMLVRVHRDRKFFGLAKAFLGRIEKEQGWSAKLAEEWVLLHRSAEELPLALEVLADWIEKEKEAARPYRLRLEIARELEDWDAAVDAAREISKRCPQDTRAELHVAHLLRAARRHKESAEELETLVLRHPDDFLLRDMLIRLYSGPVPNPRRLELHRSVARRIEERKEKR